ncbi:hypothetical protein AB0D67_30730 [Streptosporangium sp. NPDC048047]|uniref:hypothetical protein n=1 Tax=Streptosporangium sp. NPDC048047 TaxID=3155748 RepID=UPI0034499123
MTGATPARERGSSRAARISNRPSPAASTRSSATRGEEKYAIHYRPAESGVEEGAAYWNGHLLWRWQEVESAVSAPTSDLLSPWNLILGEGLSLQHEPTPYGADRDRYINTWRSWALVARQLPYATFALPAGDVLTWRIAVGLTTLVYEREPDPHHPGHECVVAGRPETYGELFDLEGICAAYQEVFSDEEARPHIAALQEHRDIPVAAYVSTELPLQGAPAAVRGLTLGHPVEMTMMHLRDAAASARGVQGIPRCRHCGPHRRISDVETALAQQVVEFTQAYYAPEFRQQGRPQTVEDLAERPYLISYSYRRHLTTAIHLRHPIGTQLHALICCLLRARDPRGDDTAPERLWADNQVDLAHLTAETGGRRH